MPRNHIAARIEDVVNHAAAAVLEQQHWKRRVLPYVGYGSVDPALEGEDPTVNTPKTTTSHWTKSDDDGRRIPEGGMARVLGRVVLARYGQPHIPVTSEQAPVRRGIKAFFVVPECGTPVKVWLGDAYAEGASDRGGYFDIKLTGHNLTHGWHQARIVLEDSGIDTTEQVQIIGGHVRFGLVSDVDDTVLNTALPRPVLAAWNTFVVRDTARSQVPGMSAFYRSILANRPDSPVFYLSTGAWNTQPVLTRFLRRNGFPSGTLLLTDWGPTQTGWFRSGREHKRAWLRRLAKEFPRIKWLLVGDDGQHDPAIYEEFAVNYPEHVAGVAIRQLTPTQQVLSHGHPLQMDLSTKRISGVRWWEGANGFVLHRAVGKELDDA